MHELITPGTPGVIATWPWRTCALSPPFVALLICKVSGIPKLEARADEKFGGDAAYEEYKRVTPVLVPRFFAPKDESGAAQQVENPVADRIA